MCAEIFQWFRNSGGCNSSGTLGDVVVQELWKMLTYNSSVTQEVVDIQ